MADIIGKTIGVVDWTFNVTNDNDVEVKNVKVKIDFRSCPDTDITSWLCANRAIALQRPLRKLKADSIRELSGNIIIRAENAGQKIVSRNEQITEAKKTFLAAGIDDAQATEYATKLVDNPELAE
jgi:hypothetical protein